MGRTRFEDLPDALSVEQVISALPMGRNGVYNAIKRGELPACRIGKRLIILKSALIRFLESGGAEQEAVEARS
jgi:excisionase family DNA binding protein